MHADADPGGRGESDRRSRQQLRRDERDQLGQPVLENRVFPRADVQVGDVQDGGFHRRSRLYSD